MALLDIQNITKTFELADGRSLTVLHNITLSINAGELLAITGQSGSGKSTLMKIIGCLDVPTTGTYLIENINTSGMTPDQLAHIRNQKVGFVFQQFNLLSDLTAQENVALPYLYAGKSEEESLERAKKMLELVDLSDRIGHCPYQLSGGQQQRVAIARALVNDPAIILADEPTGNLDSKTSDQIVQLFLNLNQKQGKTVIIITHDPDLAKQTNRIIRLLDGSVVNDSRP